MPRKLQITVHAQLPANGINGLKTGQVYERAAFSKNALQVANLIWSMRVGVIQDPGPRLGIEVVQVGPRRAAAGGRYVG
jgi:hypothetical protein